MSRTVYVNGHYVPEDQATVSVFDRGFLFADAVYEVTSVLDGKLIDFDGHGRRLGRSLAELEMDPPEGDLLEIHRELVVRNEITEGLVYLQVTRGVADRDFAYPKDTPSTLVMFTQKKGLIDSPAAKVGIKVLAIDDLRWGRRDIKTVQLLYPSMGKMMAKAAGCDDAWMVEDGAVTEGTSNNAYIVKVARSSLGICRMTFCMASPVPRCCALPVKRKWKWKSAPSQWPRRRMQMRPFLHRLRPL